MNPAELVLQLAPLVGRHLDMTRPSTPEEVRAYGAERMGASGAVIGIEDVSAQRGEPAVDVIFDYGMSFTVAGNDLPQWRFLVYADTEAADNADGVW